MAKTRSKKGSFTKVEEGAPEETSTQPTVEIDDGVTDEEILTAEAADVQAPKPENKVESALVVRAREQVKDGVKLTVVRPIKDLRRMRYGKKWYSFQRGKPCKVPAEMVPHLRTKNVI